MALEEFYQEIDYVFVSSLTGEGFDKIIEKIPKLRTEYQEVYLKDLQAKLAAMALLKDDQKDSKEAN